MSIAPSKQFRFVVDNQSAAAVTVTFKVTPQKFTSQGALEYGAQVEPTAVTGLADATQGQSGPVNNQTELDLGGHAWIQAVGTGAGDCYVYLQYSEDGTTWPTQPGVPLVTFTNFASVGTQSAVVET